MRRSIPALAACLLLSGALVAGCGGGSATTSSGEAVSGAGESEDNAPAGPGGPSTAGEAGGGKHTEAGAPASGGNSPADRESSRPAPVSKSKSEFVAKANQACAKRRREIQKRAGEILAAQKGTAASEASVLSRFVEEAVAPGLEAEAKDLRGLRPPEGDEAQVEAIVGEIESMVAKARRDPKLLTAQSASITAAHKLAAKYGIGACGALS
jgi:hypothetical protein